MTGTAPCNDQLYKNFSNHIQQSLWENQDLTDVFMCLVVCLQENGGIEVRVAGALAAFDVAIHSDVDKLPEAPEWRGNGTSVQSPFSATVILNKELHTSESERSCLHVELDFTGSQVITLPWRRALQIYSEVQLHYQLLISCHMSHTFTETQAYSHQAWLSSFHISNWLWHNDLRTSLRREWYAIVFIFILSLHFSTAKFDCLLGWSIARCIWGTIQKVSKRRICLLSYVRKHPLSKYQEAIALMRTPIIDERFVNFLPASWAVCDVNFLQQISYEAGDHVGILPQNEPDIVRRAATSLGLPESTVFSLQIPSGNPHQLTAPFSGIICSSASLTLCLIFQKQIRCLPHQTPVWTATDNLIWLHCLHQALKQQGLSLWHELLHSKSGSSSCNDDRREKIVKLSHASSEVHDLKYAQTMAASFKCGKTESQYFWVPHHRVVWSAFVTKYHD